MQLGNYFPLAALATLPAVLPLAFGAARPVRQEAETAPLRSRPARAVEARDLAELLPARTLLYVESATGSQLFERALEHPLVAGLLAAGLDGVLEAEHGAPAEVLLERLDEVTGLETLPALYELTAGGAAFGLGLYGDRAGGEAVHGGTAKGTLGGVVGGVLVLRGADERRVEQVVAQSLEQLAQRSGYPGAFRKPVRVVEGVPTWHVGDLIVARSGKLVLLTKDEAVLRACLAVERNPARSLARTPEFTANARERAAALLHGWADLDHVERLASLGDAPAGPRLEGLRALPRRPEVQLLLGPGVASIGTAARLSATLTLGDEDLELGLTADEVSKVLTPEPGDPGPRAWIEAPDRVDSVVELTGYRDLAAVFRERVELFPPQTLPAFAEAVSNLTLFAGGLDLEEQILPGLSPWVRLVVRPVPFDPGAEPELPLPAAAAIVELTDPQLGPVLVGAFQTAIGLVNVDRAQKSEDGMLLGLSLEGEVQITSARFHPPLPGDGVDVRYNLEPACAVVGRHFILGTHRALVAELAEGQPDWKEADGAGRISEHLRVLGPAVSRVIAANFEALVVQNMLDHGNTRERAEGNVRFLQTALALVRELTIEVAHPAGDRVDVVLRADLVR